MQIIDIEKEIHSIKLTQHGFFNASAGTGKTYAIEKIVEKILLETSTPLSKILVVTYTEKAAGELKDRIRKRLLHLVTNGNEEQKNKANLALSDFDSNAIKTIHGFCNRALTQYSSLLGINPDFSILTDDSQIYQKLLYEVMRSDWHKEYGADLEKILNMTGFPGLMNNILIALGKYQKGLIIKPEPDPCFKEKVLETFNKLKELQLKFQQIDRQCLPAHQPNDSKNLLLLAEQFAHADESKLIQLGYQIHGIIKNKLKTVKNVATLCNAVPVFQEIEPIFSPDWPKQMTVFWVKKIYEKAAQYKRDKNIISYNDMIGIIYDKIQSETGQNLIDAFRKDFDFGFIDEFQDTDQWQWEIFRKIFIEGTDEKKLFLIGDPKQAIYRFRGADVFAYLSARKVMETSAEFYELAVSRRASCDLIEDINLFFDKDANWFLNQGIGYEKNIALPENTNVFGERKSYCVMNLGEDLTGATAKKRMAEFIANELDQNLAEWQQKRTDKKNKPLIGILVQTRKEAAPLEEALRKKNISYSFYKKTGIYQSAEALNLFYLLQALAAPENEKNYKKALLTDFFDIPIEKILDAVSSNHTHPASKIFHKWVKLCESSKWSSLFDALFLCVETYVHSATNLRDSQARILTNYRQLFEILELAARTKKMSIHSLVDLFQNQIQKAGDEKEEGLHRLDSENPQIQILTIHASKGLEFPVVFLAGGFSNLSEMNKDYYEYHNEKNILEIDLTLNQTDKDSNGKTNKEKHDAEIKEEMRRLLYVAITRAGQRVYIPYFKKKKGQGSHKIKGIILDDLCPRLDQLAQNFEWIDASGTLTDKMPNKKKEAAFVASENRPAEVNYNFFKAADHKDKWLKEMSYSGLSIHADKSDFAENESGEEEPVLKRSPYFPAIQGSMKVGNFFHEMLEIVDFQQEMKEQPVLLKKIKASEWHNKELEILQFFEFLRNQPLFLNGLTLSSIPASDKLIETEFFYPFFNLNEKEKRILAEKSELYLTDGYLNGKIDLLFRQNNKYYLLDWKTNTLSDYSGESFEKEVIKEYETQYQIYTLAIHKWLSKNIRDYNFQENFGGIYYIYLRGLDKYKADGIYFYKPDKEDLRLFETAILNKIEGSINEKK